jgi:hypothetical protein
MGLTRIALRNLWRSPLRTVLTIAAVALSLVGFSMLRTIGGTWRQQVEQTPNNRVVTRNKLGWDHELPTHYADTIRGMDGVEDAVSVRWAGLGLASNQPEGKAELAREKALLYRHLCEPSTPRIQFLAE